MLFTPIFLLYVARAFRHAYSSYTHVILSGKAPRAQKERRKSVELQFIRSSYCLPTVNCQSSQTNNLLYLAETLTDVRDLWIAEYLTEDHAPTIASSHISRSWSFLTSPTHSQASDFLLVVLEAGPENRGDPTHR